MKYKSIIILVLAIFVLISVAGVSAGDAGDTPIASEDLKELDLFANSAETDDLKTSPEDTSLEQIGNEEIISGTDDGTFKALKNKINSASGGTIYLENNYSCESGWNSRIDITTSNLVIDGKGHTIDAKQKTGIFAIGANNVTIKNITFTNGKASLGGAIVSLNGNFNISGCVFINNHASEKGGAIYLNGNTVTTSDCTFINNTASKHGGAIYLDGNTVTTSDCTFINNTASKHGGAIYWHGNTGTTSDCTFINNHASENGGAIYWSDYTVTTSGCAFINNTAQYGNNIDYHRHDNVNLNNNWFGNTEENYNTTPNIGVPCDNWLFLNATVDPESISLAETADITFKLYLYNSTSKNITDYTSSAKVYLTLNSNGKLDKNNVKINEKVTFTPASPGTGSITASIENVAYTKTLTVTTDGTTLWDLNKTINGNTNDTITLDRNYTFNSAVDPAFADGIVINRPVTINGNGYTINANGKARIFDVTAENVVLNDINFINGNTTNSGGAVYFSGSGTVTNCNFTDNSATGDVSCGGAVYFYKNSEGNVTNCNFTNNTASYGGAIYFSEYSTSRLINCNFTDNKATGDYGRGGAIYFEYSDSYSTIANCNFTNNSARYTAGAVYLENIVMEVIYCNFVDNKLTCDNSGGGAVYFLNKGNVSNCNFTNNTASYGGAIFFASAGNVTNCNFTGNNATWYGGAIYFNSNGNVTNCNFTDNKATGDEGCGGAVYFSKNAEGNVTNCNFTNNHAEDDGGAIWMYSGSVTNCNFTNNSAFGWGGAVYFAYGSTGTVENCSFTNNNASSSGGAIYFDNHSTGTVANCNFTDNSAYYGGAIHIYYGGVENCNFTNNSVIDGDGGAIWTFWASIGNCSFVDNTATGDYSYGGAIWSYFGNVTNCNFVNNSATVEGGAIDFCGEGNVTNCSFTNNKVTGDKSYGGAVYFISDVSVINCSFTNNSAAKNGGAIYFDEGSNGRTINCNFTDNKVTGDESHGGAVYFNKNSEGNVTNCSFTNNSATEYGGAVYFDEDTTGRAINCNFTNNSARYGGAVYFVATGNVKNCNFTDNKATGSNSCGGAILFASTGTVTNCNFTNNFATNGDGGAVYFVDTGTVTNCNFTGNNATWYGGAVYFNSNGNVTNCNFTNNSARYGGAIEFDGTGTVTNCNFTNNSAGYGGAIDFEGTGTVTNCNFTDNSARHGGAVYFLYDGTVTNCNFTGNNATWYGGAVYFNSNGNVTNCNFTGNNATTGSAIYFWSTSATKTVSNSRFLNNRANAEDLKVTKNENNITIIFTGNDNLLNSIYSKNDAEVTFTNVTYWSANGITNTGSSPTTPARSKNEAGQNITIGVVVNDELVFSGVKVTDENGTFVLGIKAGENYYIGVRHDTDSYYTEKVNTTSNNTKFNVNVTSQTSNNRTVNITAKSNIPNEVIKGKLLFIVPNSNPINATYGGNGTWWAVHTFDDAGDYNVNASYIGMDNITISNATISIRYDARVAVNNKTLDLLIGDTFTIVATTTPKGLNVSFVPDDSGVYSIDENGKVTALRDGEGSILVKVEGNAGFVENSTIVNVTVSKVPTEITVLNNTLALEVSDEIDACVTLTPADAGNLTYSISNSSVVKVEDGKIIALAEGEATITVSFKGDKKYLAAENKTINVTVSKVPTNISVDTVSLDLFVGDETVIVASLTPGDAGNVTFTSSDDDIVLVEDDGNVIANGKGQAIITVSFAGDEKYAAAVNRTINVTVRLCNASVTVDNDTLDLKVDETYTINATKHPDTILLDIDYTSSNSSVVSVDKNGIVTAVGEGTAVITVSVGDGEIYAENSTNVTVTVSRVPTEITVLNNTLALAVTDEITAGVTLTPADAGNLTYSISNSSVVKVMDAKIIALAEGEATITASFKGNDKYLAAENKTISVTVKLNDARIIAEDMTLDIYANATISPVTVPSGLEVEYASGNATIAEVDVNGVVIAHNVGNTTITITTKADGVHAVNSTVINVFVNKKPTDISAEGVSTTYNVDKNLVVTLTDCDGNPLAGVNVTVELNTAENYTTDENGQINVAVGKLTPNAYTAAMTFTGNEKYLPSNATSNVVVKKATPKLTAKAKTFKTTVKTKKFAVTLKDNNGKAITKAKVTLKVGGKTYYATTNSKGKATFKITKLNKKGTYKATVTYKANKYYNKATKKAKITVKSTWKTVSKGCKDKNTVKKIQKALKDNGYYLSYKGHYLMIDGKYESCTERSVKEFQSANGLKVTGKVDEKTAKKLKII